MWYYVIGVPLVIILAVGFGALMAKKMESVLLGKVFGAFMLLFLVVLLFGVRLIFA